MLVLECLEDRLLLDANPAVIPAPNSGTGWVARLDSLLAGRKGNPDVVFLGDSITEAYEDGPGATVWNARIAPLYADDFGIAGSLTQNVLWEINAGVLSGVSPRVVVLLIGTNNLYIGETPSQTAQGIQACIADIYTHLPQAQILLLGILPRDASLYSTLRAEIGQTNQLIAPFGSFPGVRLLNTGGWFVEADGSLSPVVMPDYLHPSAFGYELLTSAISPTLQQMLGYPPPALPYQFYAVADANGRVAVHALDGTLITDFAPFGTAYVGPVSVAVGDVNGDGYDDLVVAAASGSADVRVLDGRAFALGIFDPSHPSAFELAEFFAFAPEFHIGATVAVGDIEHDGYADIVTGAAAGNPEVHVYRGKDIASGTFDPTNSSLLAHFFAYGLNFNVGVFVTVGDTTGDGYGDVITGATAGNPDVGIYRGQDIALGRFDSANPGASRTDQYFAFGTGNNEGVTVAAADFDHNGRSDVLTGSTTGTHYLVARLNAPASGASAVFLDQPPDLQGGLAVGA